MNLTRARVLHERQLVDSCIIVRPAHPLSNGKGSTNPGTTIRITERCIFRPAQESGIAGGVNVAAPLQQSRGAYRLRLRVAADVRLGDVIEYAGRSFHVIWVPPVTERTLTRVAGLEETTHG